ncbi:response regulator [Antribacter gilvus]|uniref:response regulator n=1 Tax=Antribacter gilvus TaxID=2304675 RepID=UPI000F77C44B|nr:response regulator [Antribacter gilvus]
MTTTPAHGTLRTLVVEDDPAVAALHRGFVERHPRFTVVGSAATGAEALRLALALAPQVVLLDVYLPDVGGLDVLQRLRRLPGPPVDVIATTAARELDTVRRAMAGGVQHYLVKPFTAATLHERLDEIWRLHEDVRRAASELDQDDVDRLLAGSRGHARLPKGLSERSLVLVVDALAAACREGTDASASEVGDVAGMSRVSARRYLEHLVVLGRAEMNPRYGSAGRPENRYRPSGLPSA